MGKRPRLTVSFDADDRKSFLKQFVRTKSEKKKTKRKREVVQKKIAQRERRQAKAAARKEEIDDHDSVEAEEQPEHVEEMEAEDAVNDTLVFVTTRRGR